MVVIGPGLDGGDNEHIFFESPHELVGPRVVSPWRGEELGQPLDREWDPCEGVQLLKNLVPDGCEVKNVHIGHWRDLLRLRNG